MSTIHRHQVIDKDALFTVDAIRRTITNTDPHKDLIMQGDHNSERFTFKIPRYIEGHDMLTANHVTVPFLNTETAGKNKDRKYATGVYMVSDLEVSAEDKNYLTCSWLISRNATNYTGDLIFQLVLSCTTGSTIDYRWKTDIFKDIHVIESLDADLVFEAEYVDVIEQWKIDLFDELTKYIDNSVKTHVDVKQIETNKANISELNNNLSTLRTNVNEANSNLSKEIATQTSRIDQFTSLPSGSTSGNAELIDIRVDHNGETHSSAGESIRSQSNYIIDEVRGIYAKTDNLVNRHKLVTGYLKDTDGSIISGSTDFDKYFTTDFIAVAPGVSYDIRVPVASNLNRVVFFNTPNSVNSHIDLGSGVTEKTITIPEGATFIRMSFLKDTARTDVYVSIVESGGDTSAPLKGIIDHNMVNYPVKYNENLQFKPDSISGFERLTRNLFNKFDVINNRFLNVNQKWLETDPFNTYFTSNYIAVDEGETYSISPVWSVLYFDKYYQPVGSSGEGNNSTITFTAEGIAYIRFQALMTKKDVVMMNVGPVVLDYEPYRAKFNFLSDMPERRIYTLREAMCRWLSGEKFPIGFLGDSTTDGTGTTAGAGHQTADTNAGGWGKADYTNPVAYPAMLETLLRDVTDNPNVAVYNIGYSGFSFKSIIPHYDEIFSGVYSDVKMVGINFGINDRLTTDERAYYSEFRENLIYTVEYLYSKGIQPFILTSQATLEPHCEDTMDDTVYPMRNSESINTIANGIKKEVAEEYDLELIDMNAYGEFMIDYSAIPVSDICTDHLHFKNAGHKFEAEYLYSYICGRCVNVKKGDRLTFASQSMKSDCPTNHLQTFDKPTNGFKTYMSYNRTGSEDIVVQDFVIYVDENEPVKLSAYCVEPNTQYVLVDDVRLNMIFNSTDICTLDVGVHRIMVMSGTSKSVNWIGLKIE